MLTIFATPKPFVGHIKIIQENAILSWKRLIPACEVILLGKDLGTAEAAQQFGCKHVADVACNELGTPLINSLFYEAVKSASNMMMCYVNCDIMFTNTLMEAIKLLEGRRRYLLVGQRFNVDIDFTWDFSHPEWGNNLLFYAKNQGDLNSPRGIDYFIFPKGQYSNIPDLAVGRAWWDNWMIYNTKRNFIPLIDGTKMVLAVHQNHDYSHCKGGLDEAYHKGPEVQKNLSYVDNGNIEMTIDDAEWVFIHGRMKIAFNRSWRHFNQLPVIMPCFKWPVKIIRMILKPAQKISWINKLFEIMFRIKN
jgi:hypothetical protein